jgi:hypothetical protein
MSLLLCHTIYWMMMSDYCVDEKERWCYVNGCGLKVNVAEFFQYVYIS